MITITFTRRWMLIKNLIYMNRLSVGLSSNVRLLLDHTSTVVLYVGCKFGGKLSEKRISSGSKLGLSVKNGH